LIKRDDRMISVIAMVGAASGTSRHHLRGALDHVVLAAAGLAPAGHEHVLLDPTARSRRVVHAPWTREDAVAFLTELVRELLDRAHGYLLPFDVLRRSLEDREPWGRGGFAGFKDPSSRPVLAARMIERYPNEEERRVRAGHIGYLIFEHTAEAKLVQPTFLTQFPLAVSPLARKNDADPAFCDRFEMFVCGKEIANGFSELNDPDDQRARFQAQLTAKAAGAAETMDYDDDYCRALEIGMPPAAGEGIGIDRLAMMLTNQASIRDVILFPLMRPE